MTVHAGPGLGHTDGDGRVPVVDLRHDYADLLTFAHFNDYVRDRAVATMHPDRIGDGLDLSRLVIIDDAGSLFDHSAALAMILNSAAVKQVICVAIGMAVPAEQIAVVVPSILRTELTAVLWVGDKQGISWIPGSGPDTIIRPTAAPIGGGDPVPLRDLIEALTAPEVFSQVMVRVGQAPTQVAVPGVRLVSSRLDESVLTLVQTRVLTELTSGAVRLAADPDGAAADAELTAVLKNFVPPDPTVPGGRLGAARSAAATAITEVEQLIRRSGRPWGLLSSRRGTTMPMLFRQAVTALENYRLTLAAVFLAADAGTDEQRRTKLRAEGIVLADAPVTQPSAIPDVRRLVQLSVESGRPIEQTVRQLYDAATWLLPMGSAARVPQTEQACPPAAMKRLAGPPPMPAGFGNPVVLLLTLIAPLLAGVWAPASMVTTPLAVLLLVLGAVAVRRKRFSLGQTSASLGADILTVAAVAAVAALGAAVALVLSATDLVSVPEDMRNSLPEGVAWALVGTGLLLALLTPLLWWSLLVRAWRRELPVHDLRGAESRLDAVWREASAEWVLTDARHQASDTVRALASSLDATSGAMTAHAQQLSQDVSAQDTLASPEAELTGVTIGAVGAVVRHDLTGLVLMVMTDRWAEARDHYLDGMADRADRQARERLAEYHAYVGRWGIQDPPPGWLVRSEREQLTLAWWRDVSHLRQAVAVSRPVRQLCSDSQVQMLSREVSTASGTLRFAPRTARMALTDNLGEPVERSRSFGEGDVIWTESGTAAGVLNIVPLRAGVSYAQLEEAGGQGERRDIA
ncbi:hypothetical protein F4553_006531 [Allocatelliglobosispora scoriae]|uniref:Uncharacterized protein n=1 Tax=Allocatelliglobosispora scoriae TaxID=643052 RepID=A0A841BVI0_9ACTN|nr:hypothetical protein [Allocatelliglobosispora scoriae]MBB5873097.1 hypothetical protein [Allocatelliglobosispora scoriae]